MKPRQAESGWGHRIPVTPEVEPRCRHFGVCGGCQLQHLRSTTQERLKVAYVEDRLQAAGVASPGTTVHTAEPYFYRNRIRMHVEGGRVGYRRRASNEFLPAMECPIASPLLWKAADSLQEIASTVAPWPQQTVEVEWMTNTEESELQMLLHVDATVPTLDRDAPRQFRALCDALHAAVPQLTGGGLLVRGDALSGTLRVQERQRIEVAGWGVPTMTHVVAGTRYTVSRGGFFQVNRGLTNSMVELVTGFAKGRLAWDLFAGAGLFSVPLTESFDRVVAVEVGQPAAGDLARALKARGTQNRAIAQPVSEFLKRSTSETPDLIVLDPPRAGLSLGDARRLSQIGAAEMIYVSCDANTFARDARTLVDSRYTITRLHLLDLFPQTIHTETIAVFRRG